MELNGKTIGEIAISNPNAIRVFERLRIDYCCHGNRSLEDACAAAGVNASDVRNEISAQRLTGDGRDWSRETLMDLMRYIVDTHHTYTRDTLQTVCKLAAKVADRHGANHPSTTMVKALAGKLSDDLFPHMIKEEQVLFPYVEQMERAIGGGFDLPDSCFGTVRNPIRMMMMEHDAAAEILAALRMATDDYTLPDDACISFRALYEQLMALEEDLHRHIHFFMSNNFHTVRGLKE